MNCSILYASSMGVEQHSILCKAVMSCFISRLRNSKSSLMCICMLSRQYDRQC